MTVDAAGSRLTPREPWCRRRKRNKEFLAGRVIGKRCRNRFNRHTMLGIPPGLFDHVEVAAFQDAGITGISNLLFFRRSDLDKSRRGATFHIVGIPCKCGSRSFLWISLSCRGSNPVRTGFSFHSENMLKGMWRFPTAGFSTHTASRCRSVYWLSSSLSWHWWSDIRLSKMPKG